MPVSCARRPATRGCWRSPMAPCPPTLMLARDGAFLAVLAETEHAAERAAERLATLSLAGAGHPADQRHPDRLAARRTGATHAVILERDRSRRRRRPRTPCAPASAVPTSPMPRSAPSCAVARWQDGTLEVWTHSQGVYNLRADLGKALRDGGRTTSSSATWKAPAATATTAPTMSRSMPRLSRAPRRAGRCACCGRARRNSAGDRCRSAMLVEVEASLDAQGNIASWRRADRLVGGVRADVLRGGAGAGVLIGGVGTDRLTGGPGATASTAAPGTTCSTRATTAGATSSAAARAATARSRTAATASAATASPCADSATMRRMRRTVLICTLALALALPAAASAHAPRRIPRAHRLHAGVPRARRGDSRTAWVSGNDGGVWRTTDGGGRWQDVSPPDTAGLLFRDVEANDARDARVLAVGQGDGSRIYTTTDGGRPGRRRSSTTTRTRSTTAWRCVPAAARAWRSATLSTGSSGSSAPRRRPQLVVVAQRRDAARRGGEFGFAAWGTCLVTRRPRCVRLGRCGEPDLPHPRPRRDLDGHHRRSRRG